MPVLLSKLNFTYSIDNNLSSISIQNLIDQAKNGETIYKTRGGPIAPTDETAFTQKGKTTYLHILEENKELFFVENFKGKIKSMRFYKNKEKVNYKITKYGIFIEVPNNKKDQIDTIIEIILK